MSHWARHAGRQLQITHQQSRASGDSPGSGDSETLQTSLHCPAPCRALATQQPREDGPAPRMGHSHLSSGWTSTPYTPHQVKAPISSHRNFFQAILCFMEAPTVGGQHLAFPFPWDTQLWVPLRLSQHWGPLGYLLRDSSGCSASSLPVTRQGRAGHQAGDGPGEVPHGPPLHSL